MIDMLLLVAQATAPSGGPAPAAPGTGDFLRTMLPLIAAMLVFWWLMSRGRTKERKRYEDMLGSLKRGDRVQTIGGVLGTIVDVRDNEVVLKVDESSNVKIRFTRGAIKERLADTPPAEAKR